MKTFLSACAVVALTFALGTALFASVGFTPPPPENNAPPKPMNVGAITLMAQKAAPKATGTASLICSKDKKFHVLIMQMSNLDPTAVYTVWLVKMVTVKQNGKDVKKTVMEGVGKAPYTLTVNKKGVAALSAREKDCLPAAGWQTLEVISHPDKNPKNMKDTVPILKGDVAKFVY